MGKKNKKQPINGVHNIKPTFLQRHLPKKAACAVAVGTLAATGERPGFLAKRAPDEEAVGVATPAQNVVYAGPPGEEVQVGTTPPIAGGFLQEAKTTKKAVSGGDGDGAPNKPKTVANKVGDFASGAVTRTQQGGKWVAQNSGAAAKAGVNGVITHGFVNPQRRNDQALALTAGLRTNSEPVKKSCGLC
ncbi:unnamed protein product [Amoebophrya sp. A120]|nr:unnamed protein product [Amoebophrya sp. A120]|eukprot:GSA120T00021795001.1